MYPFQRILIPTDFSLCAEAAYRHGLFLGKHFRADVHFLHVDEASQAVPESNWPDRVTAPQEGEPAYSEHWHDLLLHRVVVRAPDPVPAILDYAAKHAIDLIVIGAHGDRGTGHFLNHGVGSAFLGRTAEQVVRHATCPVMKVVMQNGGSRPDRVGRILVPMDDAALSALALTYARELAGLYGARLDLLHVLDDIDPDDAVVARAREDLVAVYKQTSGPAASVSFHVTAGPVGRRIRSFIKRHDVQMVVQGAHSDLGRDILGQVAGEVVRTVPCTVLTVRDEASTLKMTAAMKGGYHLSSASL